MLYYIRDEKNRLLGFKYNEDLYFYKKNNQEDIIGIYDSNYHLIATYVYDSWGKILSIQDSSGNEITDSSHIAIINPFRYRSYYYDEETKLYYLNARYYNPEWGRFLNADSIIGAKGKIINYNLYDYCENNPINKIDSNGQFALAITGIIGIGLGISAATKALLGMVTVATVTTMAICYTQTAVKARDRAIAENKNIGNHNVYVLVDPNKKTSYGNKVEYVGRTTNLKARAEQHSRNDYKKDLVMYIVAKDTTREVARGTEQGLIEYYQTLNRGNYRNNQINGVNPNRKEAYDRYRGRMIDYFGNETYVGGIEW